MKHIGAITSGVLLALIQVPLQAGDAELFDGWASVTDGYIQLADNDDRKDRRNERGRSDERDDRRDCRQEEGRVGDDKRDCKQDEVRDGAKGDQGDAEDEG
jgi:hypothetical protein